MPTWATSRKLPRRTGIRARDYVEFGIDSVVTALRIMLESDNEAAAASDNGSRSGSSRKVPSPASRR